MYLCNSKVPETKKVAYWAGGQVGRYGAPKLSLTYEVWAADGMLGKPWQ